MAPSAESLASNCLRELRSRIIGGRIPTATKLRETQLAAELNVSRTPLRAAMLHLAQEGLLERAGGGYAVRTFSFRDALIAIELRGVIEGTAARLAAELPAQEKDLNAISATVAELDTVLERDQMVEYATLNDRFHEQLAQLSGSTMIKQEVERASRLPFAAPSAFSSSKDDFERFKASLIIGQQHHHALVQSIARGEGSRAEALAREHAHLAKTNIEVAVRERSNTCRLAPQIALIAN